MHRNSSETVRREEGGGEGREVGFGRSQASERVTVEWGRGEAGRIDEDHGLLDGPRAWSLFTYNTIQWPAGKKEYFQRAAAAGLFFPSLKFPTFASQALDDN